MGKKEIFVGLFAILVILGIVIGVNKAKTSKNSTLNIPTPKPTQSLESKFNLTIPSDVEKIDLKKVGNIEGMGVATRKFANGTFSQMIMADLPDPQPGAFYEGWLEKDSKTVISTGILSLAKGGYLLEFNSTTDYSDYKTVVVSLEKSSVSAPQNPVLQGSF